MYYTRKYTRPPNHHPHDQINSTLRSKRFSFPSCDPSTKSKTVPTHSSSQGISNSRNLPSIPLRTDLLIDLSSNNTVKQQQNNSRKPLVHKSCSTLGISRCEDQTPLLTSELPLTSQDSSNHTIRQYSFNAVLPINHPSNSRPLNSSTVTAAVTESHASDPENSGLTNNGKSHSRSSLVKSAQISSISTNPNKSTIYSQSLTEQTNINVQSELSSFKSKRLPNTNGLLRKNSSTITSIAPPYRKDFMQKIERFRFIDDSASSTTTVTSPVESLDRINNGHETCSHLITSAIEQFDDYVRSRYRNNDEINSYIDRLNSETLTNGSYSDLNILNSSDDAIAFQRSPNQTQPVSTNPPIRRDEYLQAVRNSTLNTIPSSHQLTLENSIIRPTTITNSGHSRSMDFSLKSDLTRPVSLKTVSTIYETSSSSLATLASSRSNTSVEFDDDTKPSGVLVDDDFLPMSSPVDDHFWDLSHFNQYSMKSSNSLRECFPDVGSSPVVEKKSFHFQPVSNLSSSIDPILSETSCDDDDEDERQGTVTDQQKYSIHQYQLKELEKPLVIHRSTFNPSFHVSERSSSHELITVPIKRISVDLPNPDESLLEKFASTTNELTSSPIHSPRLRPIVSSEIVLTNETIYEEDDTQESSTNENGSDESADNGEIDLLQEFEFSQRQDDSENSIVWNNTDRDIFIVQEDDFLSALVSTPISQTAQRPLPPSIMKLPNQKSIDNIDEPLGASSLQTTIKPKVRFNLDPQYEREREWNKVNKLLGHSVEWTDEFEV